MTMSGSTSDSQRISVVDPVGDALRQMVRVLFKPFRAGSWFGIGFMAFMTTNVLGILFAIGFQIVANAWPLVPEYFDEERTDRILNWYQGNLLFFWAVTIAVLLLLATILVVLSWIRSRGIMMLLHGSATGRGSIPQAWRESRVPGNSLFRWRILMLMLGLVGIVLGGMVLWAASSTSMPADPSAIGPRAGGLPKVATSGIILASLIWVCALLVSSLVNGLIDAVLVPAMYVRGCSLVQAFRSIRTELLPGQFWTFVGFIFFQLALAFIVGFAVQIIALATCCLGTMPYIGSVLQLPVVIAYVAYQLAFYQQFGEGWCTLPVTRVAGPPPGPVPPTSPTSPVQHDP